MSTTRFANATKNAAMIVMSMIAWKSCVAIAVIAVLADARAC